MQEKQYRRLNDKAKKLHKELVDSAKFHEMEKEKNENWQTSHKAYDLGKPSEKVAEMMRKVREKRETERANTEGK